MVAKPGPAEKKLLVEIGLFVGVRARSLGFWGLRETAVRRNQPPQGHLMDPRKNPDGRRPGWERAGDLEAAPTSAISLCLE